MAVTRIKNNQITDSTITYQKIAPGTLVGSVFNANLTLNSNVTIAGNLTVSGNTTTVDSIDTLVSDNLITLNNGYVGVPAYDVGILFNRALGTLENYGGVNAALVWSESDGAFIAVLTTETGTTAGTINRTFQANMIVGNLTVSNTATIQTATITNLNVTNQNVAGLTSTGNIVAASGTVATNYTTGAIVVPDGGGVGITGDLWVQGPSTFAGNIVAGNILLSGNINVPVGGTFSNLGVFFGNAGGIGALYAGTPTYTALPTTVLQMSGNVDTYAQVNFQNINSGTKASTDFVLTADNGNDTDGFIDLGINSSTFNDANYPGSYPNDGYLIHHSGLSTGNLLIFSHTEGSAIKLHVGDYGDANTKATVTSTGFRVNTSTASTSTTSGALTVDGGVGVAGNIHAAAINNTPIGNTTPSTGRFTYLTVDTGFSTANAIIDGGNINLGNNYVQAAYINSFYSNSFNILAANLTVGNVEIFNGNVSANLSSTNAVITGGYIDETPIGPNIASTGNFTTANATSFTGYDATVAVINSTDGNITTLAAGNFSSSNVIVTGGFVDETPIGPNIASTGNFTTANATSFTGYDATVAVINSTNGNITTLAAGNFSTANAVITGGYADNFPIGANTATTGNFTTANATSFTGYDATVAVINSTTGNITTSNSTTVNAETTTTTNLNSTNGNITTANLETTTTTNLNSTNGNITTSNSTTVNAETTNTTNLNSTNGNVTTLVANNFSTANAVVTGGYADNFPIGANTASTGAFTSLTSNGLTTFTDSTESDNSTSGAVVVTGGVGIGGNLNVGGNIVVTGNLTVQGNTTVLNTETLNVEDLNITVAANATTGSEADGAGLTVAGANATLTYVNATDSWEVNKPFAGLGITMFQGNFTSANITTLSISDVNIATATIATLNSTLANITTGNIDTINSANGNITTLLATNFNTANAVVTGGSLNAISIGATTPESGNFTTANAASFTSYNATIATINSTTGNITTSNSTTINAVTTTTVDLNATNSNATTLVSTNFSTANAVVTGGYINSLANLTATQAQFTDFSTANALVTGGLISNTDAQINNFSSGNVLITGGYIDQTPIGTNTASTGNFTTANATTVTAYSITGTDLNATNGNVTTLVANNFSTANAVVTGGYADNFPIGANIAATGNFTSLDSTSLDSTSVKTGTLNVTANVYLSPQTAPATVTINPLNGGAMDGITIGATNAANVYATNFRTSTSLNVAPSGPVWIQGGTGTNGINNIPIGAVTPSSGVFTTVNGQTITGTTVNGTNGNVTTLVATNFSSGNVVVSGGYISALTNAYVTTGLITNFSTANARITGGFADNFPVGANTRASGAFTTLTAHSLNATVIGNVTPAAATFTTINGTTGTFTGEISATGITTSGNTASSLQGNVTFSNGTFVVNNSNDDWEIVVRGVNENSLLKVAADTVYDQVSIGGNITAANITQGAKLVINSTDAVVLPVGTSAQRPGAVGFADVDGMIRYNSTINSLEFYGDGEWNSTASTFTTILSRTFADSSGNPNGNVDGVNTQFTLAASSTTAGTLVSISGVLQIPTTAYTVSGNVVTFTEAPAIDDVIDTRIITTTTTVDTLAAPAGYNQYFVDDTALRFYTGNLSLGSVENWRMDTHGDFYPVTTANIGYASNRVDYFYVSNLNVSGTITGASLSSGSLDDTVIGANIARPGHFTTLFADSTFTTNAEHVTDDIRGKYVSPSGTDAVYEFATATYRSGKFFVQLSDENAGEYQAAEVVAVHNGTTCSIEVYGVTFTGVANLATFSTNVSAGTAYLNASSAGANLAIKVTPTLMKL